MLTGDIRSQIDAIWNAFWTGGISNPLEVIEQIYRRQTGGSYAYESPRFNYAAVLDVDATGFVRRYPTLWDAVTED